MYRNGSVVIVTRLRNGWPMNDGPIPYQEEIPFFPKSPDQRWGLYSPVLTFRRRIKSRLPFAGIIRRLPYFTGFQDKG